MQAIILTVAIPCCGEKLGLLSIYRHAPRRAGLEFPRGFAEKQGLTLEQNIRKELSEEMNISPEGCSVKYLGTVQADSGLATGSAAVYLAEFPDGTVIQPSDEEGIMGFRWYSIDAFQEMIANNQITDGFTLSAFAKYSCAVKTG